LSPSRKDIERKLFEDFDAAASAAIRAGVTVTELKDRLDALQKEDNK